MAPATAHPAISAAPLPADPQVAEWVASETIEIEFARTVTLVDFSSSLSCHTADTGGTTKSAESPEVTSACKKILSSCEQSAYRCNRPSATDTTYRWEQCGATRLVEAGETVDEEGVVRVVCVTEKTVGDEVGTGGERDDVRRGDIVRVVGRIAMIEE